MNKLDHRFFSVLLAVICPFQALAEQSQRQRLNEAIPLAARAQRLLNDKGVKSPELVSKLQRLRNWIGSNEDTKCAFIEAVIEQISELRSAIDSEDTQKLTESLNKLDDAITVQISLASGLSWSPDGAFPRVVVTVTVAEANASTNLYEAYGNPSLRECRQRALYISGSSVSPQHNCQIKPECGRTMIWLEKGGKVVGKREIDLVPQQTFSVTINVSE